jgi:hypothetical protein
MNDRHPPQRSERDLGRAVQGEDRGFLQHPTRTLTACGFTTGLVYHVEVARACLAEAIGLART